ncbi:hypothetical protein G3578_17920 [Brevibacillus sp. SYP-B805]|uniref:hypothetical protein n=1 Tax=Brevibacillus sp. SYP-B805 TaxID=1578199 RepID=UPI0013ED074B|nr:hypothetical protein [Brevibacillus sp. SYP-B805]NGQ97043.1 hypothetical protein [Brevibacillus sp. SYP-B805]
MLDMEMKRGGKKMRRLFRSSAVAGIFAFLILLMNVFPYAAIAAAEGLQPGNMAPGNMAPGNMAPGNMAPGNMQPGKLQPGDLHWDTSQYQPGSMQPGDLSPGDLRPEDMRPGDMQPGILRPGDLQPGRLQPGNLRPGNMQPGDVKPGEIRPGSTELGNLQPGDLHPGNLQPPKQNGRSAYEGIKYSVKDIMGGTLGYTAGLIELGEVDLKTALKGKGLLLGGFFVKGMDLVFKDTPFMKEITGLGIDSLDGWSLYENYKFVMNSNAITKFGDKIQSLPHIKEMGLPGIAKGLNVGAAAISFGFDMYDTFDNFKQAQDLSKSEEERKEKFVDGVGNLGSAMMDAGVIASVIPIPFVQAVGTVLFVAGAILWGASRIVKYYDKIKNGVTAAVGWVKSIFA